MTAINDGDDATQLESLNDELNSIEDDANTIAESLDLDDSCQRGELDASDGALGGDRQRSCSPPVARTGAAGKR